ncbi:MAG: hypothetical protein JXA20_01685 [Spirochaetes bacterium]|nr:hypothetical protein [Spirochaetota bacterium]
MDLASRLWGVRADATGSEGALKSISRIITSELGQYFGPEILDTPDELMVSFIELLDQIVFEIEENTPSDGSIKEYIIDDLYLRLGKYLDALHDMELYKQNLGSGFLTREDTVIIRHFGMNEFMPELMAEYHERPVLKKSILRSLLAFSSEKLITFYYQIAKEDGCVEARILALLGLKLHGSKFRNWKHLRSGDVQFDSLIEYVSCFDAGQANENGLPEDIYTLMFAINFIEQMVVGLKNREFLHWTVEVLKTITFIGIPVQFQSDMYTSIANILTYCDADVIRDVLSDEAVLKSFIHLLEVLPPETFRRVTVSLAVLGSDFTEPVTKLISTGEVIPREGESNIMGYLLWGGEAVML